MKQLSPLNLVPKRKRQELTIPAESDPFPFSKTGWLGKSVMLLALIAPFIAVIWAIFTLWGSWVTGLDIALVLIFWTIAGIGVTLGFHRMLSHRAFEARAPLRLVLLIAAATSIQGRPSDWAATHIRHHARADLEGDPHSPLEGFIHAHFGWLLRDRMVREGPVWERLHADPVTRFVDNTWGYWVLATILAPAAIGFAVTGTFMGALTAFIWGTGVRIFIVHHLTWAVNSLGHVFGTRPNDTEDKSRNNGVLALVTWGEGWHNNHHAEPRSPFMARKWWQVDIGAYFLWAFRGMGLVKSFWRPRAYIKERTEAISRGASEAAGKAAARAGQAASSARQAASKAGEAASNAAKAATDRPQNQRS